MTYELKIIAIELGMEETVNVSLKEKKPTMVQVVSNEICNAALYGGLACAMTASCLVGAPAAPALITGAAACAAIGGCVKLLKR